jgi:hypothetical protein
MEIPGIEIVKTALDLTSSVNERKQMLSLTLRICLVFTELPLLKTLRGIGGGCDPKLEKELEDLQLMLAKRWGKYVCPSSQRHAMSTLKSVNGFMFITNIHVINCPNYTNDGVVRILGRDVQVEFSIPVRRRVRNIVYASESTMFPTTTQPLAVQGQSELVVDSVPEPCVERSESTLDVTIDRILDYANSTLDYANSTLDYTDNTLDYANNTLDYADNTGDTRDSCTRDSDEDDYGTLCSCGVSSGVVGNMARCIPISFHETNCTIHDRPYESSERSCQFVVLRTLRQSAGAHTTDESMWTRIEWTTIAFTMDVRIEARRLMRPNSSFAVYKPLYKRCEKWIRWVVLRPYRYVWTFRQGAVFVIVGTFGDNWIISPTKCSICGDKTTTFGYGACEQCMLIREVDEPLILEKVHHFYLFPLSLGG